MRRVVGIGAAQYIKPNQPHVNVLERNSEGMVVEEERRSELSIRIGEQRRSVVVVSVRAIRGPAAGQVVNLTIVRTKCFVSC